MRGRKSIRVLIAIQARSTSKRFPEKSMAMIGQKTMTEMVLGNVEEAIGYIERNDRDPVDCQVALLIPTGDKLKKYAAGRCAVIEGSEDDVLSRFQKAFVVYRPDYVCRITGDCPLLPDFVISKHIRSALFGRLDYCTNADPSYRTSVDGWDCEVMSRRMMEWLFANVQTAYDREHVTTLVRSATPEWANVGYIIEHLDLSHMKLSVDTPEDLERVREQHDMVERKLAGAKTSRSKSIVYRL
jgi:glutamate-1-semialdehyde 2,1-aminomutase